MDRTVRTRQLRTSQQECALALAETLTVGMEDEMVAYWVARSKVNNPEQYKKYADLAPAIIGKFGGKFLARREVQDPRGPGEIPTLHRHRVPELRDGCRMPQLARVS